MQLRLATLLALALTTAPLAAPAAMPAGMNGMSGMANGDAVDDESIRADFVVGRYDIVGRHPDSTRSYSGQAVIERAGRHLRLTREIAGKRTEVYGIVRRASPGEAWVLSFAWGSKPTNEMVCLIGSDLDNYARLSCHWGRAGNPHKRPGVEAYFSQEPWKPVE